VSVFEAAMSAQRERREEMESQAPWFWLLEYQGTRLRPASVDVAPKGSARDAEPGARVSPELE
jgi:hypothetical protein